MKLDCPCAFAAFSAEDGTAKINGGASIAAIVTFTGDPVTGGATLHQQAGEQLTFRFKKSDYAAPVFGDKITYLSSDFRVKQFFSEQDFWVCLATGSASHKG